MADEFVLPTVKRETYPWPAAVPSGPNHMWTWWGEGYEPCSDIKTDRSDSCGVGLQYSRHPVYK